MAGYDLQLDLSPLGDSRSEGTLATTGGHSRRQTINTPFCSFVMKSLVLLPG